MENRVNNTDDNLNRKEAGLDQAGPNDVQEENTLEEDRIERQIASEDMVEPNSVEEGEAASAEEEGTGDETEHESSGMDLKKKVKELEDRLKELEEENERYLFRLQRLQADFSNYKKRIQKERSALEDRAVEDFIINILPVLDNLERALSAADAAGEGEQEDRIAAGVRMVYNQLVKILEDAGLERIEILDREFDPHYHEAVMKVEAEGKEENQIVEEMQPGYMYKGKVIRPAMVKVAK